MSSHHSIKYFYFTFICQTLSVPTHIGSMKSTGKAAITSADIEDSSPSAHDVEYLSLLTKGEEINLTEEERSEWKAIYDDLSLKRKSFKGAATYAYGGVFSWSMYSAAEARDENGQLYTEYLMRCQWGTDWNNMQPWIVARRFREFVTLDGEVRHLASEKTPDINLNIPKEKVEKDILEEPARKSGVPLPALPTRFSFSVFNADKVDITQVNKRKVKLEEYMSCIVTHHPQILKNPNFDRFLGIRERIVGIRKLLASGVETESTTGGIEMELQPKESSEKSDNTSGKDENVETFDYGKVASDIKSPGSVLAPGTTAELKGDEDEPVALYSSFQDVKNVVDTLMSSERAEDLASVDRQAFIDDDFEIENGTESEGVKARTQTQIISLDEDSVGRIEEGLVEISRLQKGLSSKRYLMSTKVHRWLLLFNELWPALKRAASLGDSTNTRLVPRAMQADEEVTKSVNEFKGLFEAFRLGLATS